MDKLITLQERWKQLYEEYLTTDMLSESVVESYNEYIDYTAQPLELGQFIPCNSKGEPMEKPREEDGEPGKKMEYQKALDKVLFEGWDTMIHSKEITNGYGAMLTSENNQMYFMGSGRTEWEEINTIEDLITSGIDLTPSPTLREL